MRINDLNRNLDTQNTEQASQTGQTRSVEKESAGKSLTGGSTVASAGADQAEVSNLAQSLAAPAPASERVEQLRLSVQAGNYDVPALAVANALIDAHLSD